MRHIIRTAMRATACAALAAGGALALVAPASAAPPDDPAPPSTPAPPAPAATSTVSLPLLGAPVTVAVTTDAGGGLLDVSLSPSDGLTANPVHLNHVSFVNEDGTVKLRVAAVWGGERVSARAGSLADISGPGGWSGDVFGTGETTDVAFTVGATAEGGPDITGVTVASPISHTIGEVEHDSGWGGQSAKVTIEFADQGQKRWLTIKATTSDHDDGSAGLKVSLSHPWGARIEEGGAGAHTWTGALCDGTAATVGYTVTDTGEITDVTATPEADVRTMGKFAWVGFGWFEGVSIFAHEGDDGLQVGAIDKIHCAPTFPTIDGEETETASWPGWPGWGDGGHRGPGWGGWGTPGGHGGGWGGHHDDGDDDGTGDEAADPNAPSGSAAPAPPTPPWGDGQGWGDHDDDDDHDGAGSGGHDGHDDDDHDGGGWGGGPGGGWGG